MTTQDLLNKITDLYLNGNQKEADRLYNEVYLPAAKKEAKRDLAEVKRILNEF